MPRCADGVNQQATYMSNLTYVGGQNQHIICNIGHITTGVSVSIYEEIMKSERM